MFKPSTIFPNATLRTLPARVGCVWSAGMPPRAAVGGWFGLTALMVAFLLPKRHRVYQAEEPGQVRGRTRPKSGR